MQFLKEQQFLLFIFSLGSVLITTAQRAPQSPRLPGVFTSPQVLPIKTSKGIKGLDDGRLLECYNHFCGLSWGAIRGELFYVFCRAFLPIRWPRPIHLGWKEGGCKACWLTFITLPSLWCMQFSCGEGKALHSEPEGAICIGCVPTSFIFKMNGPTTTPQKSRCEIWPDS